MDLYLLDKDFLICAIISSFADLRWKRSYYDPGSFSFMTLPPASPEKAKFVYRPDCGELGEIISLTGGTAGAGLKIAGNMAENILSSRVISEEEAFSGNLEGTARSLVYKYAISGSRAVSSLSLGAAAGYTDTADAGMYGEALSTKLYSLLRPAEASYRVSYDFALNRCVFSVYRGKDRTQGQAYNAPVVFSESYGNFTGAVWISPAEQRPNFAYIKGCDGAAELDTAAAGEKRRELFVRAEKLRRGNMSEAAYRSILLRYGLEMLKAAAVKPQIKLSLAPGARPSYRSGFDIGDICSVECPSLGFSASARVASVEEVWSEGGAEVTVAF